MVSPPGTVIAKKAWSNGRRSCTFVYLEVRKRRRVELSRLARRIGRGAKKRLTRGGLVTSDFAQRMFAAWAE